MKYYKILFPILVLIVLIIPLFHMNTSEITKQENRTLAKFPELKKKGKLNTNYGKEFESWLSDRFWGRNQLIDARFQALYKINGRIENEKAFIGDDGWMFEKSKTIYIPSIKKQRKKVEKNAQMLKKLADKFKEKNIQIYLVLIPEREVLYHKYWEKYYEPNLKLDYGEEIIKLIKNTPNIKVIYPKEEFKKYLSIEPLYIKIDQHPTFTGASIFRKKVFDTLKKDFFAHQNFTYEIIPPTNYKGRGIANMLGIRYDRYKGEKSFFVKDIKFTPNTHFEVTVAGKLREADQVWPAFEMTTNKNPIHKSNLFVLGGCIMQGVNRLFVSIFSHTYYFRLNDWGDEEEIKESNKNFDLYLSKVKSNDVIVLTPEMLNHRYLKKLLTL